MNKQEFIKSETWTKFFEQKFEELKTPFCVIMTIATIIFLPYLVGLLSNGLDLTTCVDADWADNAPCFKTISDCDFEAICDSHSTWFNGLIMIITPLTLIIIMIAWLKDNWIEAKEEAEEEWRLREKRKKKNKEK